MADIAAAGDAAPAPAIGAAMGDVLREIAPLLIAGLAYPVVMALRTLIGRWADSIGLQIDDSHRAYLDEAIERAFALTLSRMGYGDLKAVPPARLAEFTAASAAYLADHAAGTVARLGGTATSAGVADIVASRLAQARQSGLPDWGALPGSGPADPAPATTTQTPAPQTPPHE